MDRAKIFDALTQLKDAGLIAADAACEVDSVAKVLNLGDGYIDFKVVLDVTAVEVDTGDELYKIRLQLSTDAAFTSPQDLCVVELGDAATLPGGTDKGTGRYVIPACNEINGVVYPYFRLYTDVAGTLVTGINYSAFASK